MEQAEILQSWLTSRWSLAIAISQWILVSQLVPKVADYPQHSNFSQQFEILLKERGMRRHEGNLIWLKLTRT